MANVIRLVMPETWKLHHLGIPVPDLDQAIENFQTLGNATFEPEFLIDSAQMQEYLVYGKVPDPIVRTRGAMGTLGPLGIELLQPLQGHTVHKELLESVGTGGLGAGIGHIAYTVDDLEAEAASLVEKGFPVILSITPKGQTKRSAIYFDTRSKLNNLIVELMQAR